MSDGINDAFEAAYAELGLGDTPEDGPATEPEEAEPEGESEAEAVEDGDTPELQPDEDADADEGETDTVDPVVVEIVEGATLRLPDGTEVPADKAVLFQQAWTKKTTELAEQRREFENERVAFEGLQQQTQQTFEDMQNWYQTRAAAPAEWINEIALESENPTRTIAKAIYELGRSGKLDPKFMETFGIEEGIVSDVAQDASRDDEVAALRERLDAQERQTSEEVAIQRRTAEYQGQWDDIKLTYGVQFANAKSETEAKRELMEFAVAKRLTHSLPDAYALMQAVQQSQQPDPAPTPDPVMSEKKRALSAVNPRSAGGGSRGPAKAVPRDSRAAALEAIAEFGL